jgi:pilus assembly protein CpaB
MRAAGPRQLRHAASRHRVLLAAGLTAAAVASGLSAVAPAGPETVPVLVAARDLPAGAALTPDVVLATAVPRHLVPSGALSGGAAAGQVLAGPVRRGESLTDVRLLGAALLPPGSSVAVPVRVAEPATAALVAAGDRVDVLSAAAEGGAAARLVASGLSVLAVPTPEATVGEGALLVLAASRETAARLAAAAVTGRLSVAVHGR